MLFDIARFFDREAHRNRMDISSRAEARVPSNQFAVTFLAKAGGLYTISYWLFYFMLMQVSSALPVLSYL